MKFFKEPTPQPFVFDYHIEETPSIKKLQDLYKPSIFIYISGLIFPYLATGALMCLFSGLFLSLYYLNVDFQQGENYKILYIHVPSAWLAIFLYLALVITNIYSLITKHPIYYYMSISLARTGTYFTALTLLTGSLWGFPVWGTFWVWDARLTSVLVLFFLYLVYLLIISLNKQNYKYAAYLALFGFFNIPIIKYSVEWWNTLHQPASLSLSHSAIHNSILIPLSFYLVSFILYTLMILIISLRLNLLEQKIKIITY